MKSKYRLSIVCWCLLEVTLVGRPVDAAEDMPTLVAAKVAKAPKLDGELDDAWRPAKPLTVTVKRVLPPNVGKSTDVVLRCVYTDAEIFVAATWADATESITHKTWVWSAEKKAYETGSDREDMLAVAFEHSGEFNTNMLAGVEAVWDVWHWKAFRTNPQGYATDKTHLYTLAQPGVKAKSYEAKNGKTIWIARPEDKGDTVEKSVPAPTEFNSERVAAYVPGTPSGSAADVRAKGKWAEGKWNLELGRKLVTGNSDDTAFDVANVYQLAIASFDQTGDMDKASGRIVLQFAK